MFVSCCFSQMSDVVYTGSVEDQSALRSWVTEHCLPLVREITFQNGEEMTEMGLPLLILFYHPEDASVKELFKQRVEAELKEHRGRYWVVVCVFFFVFFLLLFLNWYFGF